ncbi:MAG TPA: VTT domain-containing protein [Terriglobales bacterium]|nr:VTT domain-containing protein [Terriglobales bacterium]
MSEIVSLLERHGYAVLALIVFLEAVGVPVPAALALVAAGTASAWHHLRPEMVVIIALSAMLLGDTLLFILGRYSGWALLGFLCRIALNPESCILRSAESFYRRGRTTLMFAKFIPGINTLAPPLAGSMRMGFGQFLRLDCVGAFLYTLAYAGFGYLFSGVIVSLAEGAKTVGRAVEWLLLVALIGYVAYRVYLYGRHRKYRVTPRVQVEELARKLSSGEAGRMTVADVRSHGYYDPGAVRIKGSIRLEPNNLLATVKDWPRDREIYLYCT